MFGLLSGFHRRVHNQSADNQRLMRSEFGIERLEDRRLLAGQVNVIVVGYNIGIVGDNESQDVIVLADSGFVRVAVGPDTSLVGDVDANGRTTVPEDQLRNLVNI